MFVSISSTFCWSREHVWPLSRFSLVLIFVIIKKEEGETLELKDQNIIFALHKVKYWYLEEDISLFISSFLTVMAEVDAYFDRKIVSFTSTQNPLLSLFCKKWSLTVVEAQGRNLLFSPKHTDHFRCIQGIQVNWRLCIGLD